VSFLIELELKSSKYKCNFSIFFSILYTNRDNTECYSCCKGDDCNTLEAALKELPDDIFESEKPTKKGKKNKGKKADDEDDDEQENKEKIDEKEDDNNDEEDKDVKGKKEEKKKSKKKDKKSKSKEENPEKEEKNDDENPEDPEEEKSDKNDQDDKKVDNSVAISNETSAKVTNESPENGTVVEKTISNDNSQTVVATNITANATEEGTGNNNNTEEVIEPLDPNIQEINKTLNETVDVVEDLMDNLDNAGNAENVENNGLDLVEPKDVAENSTNSNFGLEETKVEDGTLYKSPEDENKSPDDFDEANNDPNMNNETGEQHGLYDAPSSSTKYQISEILLLTTSIIILVQFL